MGGVVVVGKGQISDNSRWQHDHVNNMREKRGRGVNRERMGGGEVHTQIRRKKLEAKHYNEIHIHTACEKHDNHLVLNFVLF